MKLLLSHICIAAVLLPVLVAESFADEQELRIGVLADLSGRLAPIGEQCRQGTETAHAVYAKSGNLKGRTVKFVFADHQAIPRVGLSEFRRLVSVDKIHVLMGNRSPVAIAVNPLSERQGIPYLGIISHKDFINTNRYAFRLWPSGVREGQVLGKRAVESGAKTAAVVSWEDDWALAIQTGFLQAFKQGGGDVVYSETILDTEMDLSTIVTRIAQAKPDAVLANLGIGQAPQFYKKLRERNVKTRIFSNFLSSLPQVINAAGAEAIEGVVIAQLDRNKEIFLKHFHQLYGGDLPPPMSYGCYAAAATALSALESVPGEISSEALYKALVEAKEIKLPDGPVKIIDRELQLGLVFAEIRNGKEVIIGREGS